MLLSEPARETLLRLIRLGLDHGIERLTQISGASWQVSDLSVCQGTLEETPQPSPAGAADYYGAYFTIAGGVFLVAMPEASAAAVAQSFFRRFSRKSADAWKGKENDAVGEIANMVVNPVANILGDNALMTIFLSSPQVVRGGWQELDDKAFEKLVLREDKAVLRADIGMDSQELSSSCRIVIIFNSAFAGHLAQALENA